MNSHTSSLQRWTALLSLVLAALVGGMVFLLWQDTQPGENQSQDTALASSIRIQRETFADIVMTKNQDQWTMESPCSVLVNEQRLMPLLSALEPGGHQYLAAEIDRQAAGLERPSAIVYLNELEHRIGNTDLKANRRYLQRGNHVEFVPEWVLSLVNGGVSALAQLELFPEPISSITIFDSAGGDTEYSSLDELTRWQNLSAQQIINWPVEGAPVSPSFSLTAKIDQGNELQFQVFETDTFLAFRLDEAECAYILPLDALPE